MASTNTKNSFSISEKERNKQNEDIQEKEVLKQTRHLLTEIIESTTAMPFRKNGHTFRCFYCETDFYYASELRDHTQSNHKNEPKRKLKQIINKNITKRNFLAKLDVTNLSCKLCTETFERLQELLFHLSRHKKEITTNFDNMLCVKLSDTEFKCLYCSKEFQFFKNLYLHLHREHVKKHFICDGCGINFTTKQGLDNHASYVHSTGSFKCDYCDKIFGAEHLRTAHVKRSHDTAKLKCNLCKVSFGSVIQKETHLAKEHNIWVSKEFKCEKCPMSFKYNHMLVRHDKRVHLKVKNLACDICGDKFFEKRLLELHQASHSKSKPYRCDLCFKRFPRKNSVYRHLKTHQKGQQNKAILKQFSLVDDSSSEEDFVEEPPKEQQRYSCIVFNKNRLS